MMRSECLVCCLLLLGALALPAAAQEGREMGKRDVPTEMTAKGGLILYLGCGNGRSMVEHARGGSFLVHGLAADDSELNIVRTFIRSQGVYGKVSVSRQDVTRKLPYADNLANRVVVPDESVVSRLESPLEEITRVLCPEGVAILGPKAARALGVEPQKLIESLRSDPHIAQVETIKGQDSWLMIRKKRPQGMGQWTHFRYGPEGNAVSPDTLVGVPDSLRWIADSGAWPKAHFDHVFAAVSAGGRLFCILDESPAGFQVPRQPFLIARDAYNGILLWKRPVPAKPVNEKWTHGQRRDAWIVNNLVAVGDHVFVPDTGNVLKLKASTGRVVCTFEDIREPRQMVVSNGRLLVTGSDKKTPLQCLDAETGNRRWKHTSNVEHFICGEDRVFFIDPEGHTVCLDADTGRPKWHKSYKGIWKGMDRLGFRRVVSCNEDLLITSGQAGVCALQGISAGSGRHLWSFTYTDPIHNTRNSAKNAFILDGLVWVNRQNPGKIPNNTSWIGLDPSTGKIKENVPYGPAIHRCRPAQATERFFFCGSFGACDRRTGAFHRIRAARGSCGFGILPANGLVYTFPQSCECDAYLRGCMAFTTSDSNRQGNAQHAPTRQPLIEGPAFAWAAKARTEFDVKAAEEASAKAWPCYRHDARRSGATQTVVSAELRNLWKAQIDQADSSGRDVRSNAQADNGPISAPVAAGGLVFVAVKDRHQIVALDAATGAQRWSFTAGGRIDSPPTVYGALCLFGSRDGWIYSVRAQDGVLVWRFRGAPRDRLIVVDRQLESSWPVGGSVIVDNDVLYAAAGRHTELDGGLVVYALDPWSGTVIWKTRKARKQEKSFDRTHTLRMEWLEKGTGRWRGQGKPSGFRYRVSYQDPVSLGGLLASDGDSVYLGSWPYGPSGKAETDSKNNFIQTKNGFFDPSWNFRNWWMDRRIGGHLLSFNSKRTFAIRMKGFVHRWEYHANLHKPGTQFELLAQSRDIPRDFFVLKSTMKVPADWVRGIPVVGDAMVLAREVLFVAGTPDKLRPEGGLLIAYSVKKGEHLTEYDLDAPPVFDGMAATSGRLFLSTRDGKLLCFSDTKTKDEGSQE